MIDSLIKIATDWQSPNYALRRQAIEEGAVEFRLSQENFTLALDWIFSLWTEERISAALAKNPFKKSKYAVQILAGNTPAIIAQGFLQSALLHIPQCIKVPCEQSIFAKLLQQSFKEKALPPFEMNAWQDNLSEFYTKLAQADLVIAYGQDETLDTLKKYISSHTTFICHGHAESAAILFKESANRTYLEKLKYDMLSYDQRGCLSPRMVFVEKGGELSPEMCAKIFAEEILPPLAQQLPRGGLFDGEAALILHQRNVYGFRGQVYSGPDWTVCYAEKQPWPSHALPRFIPFMPFTHSEELIEILDPVKNHLISLGCAGQKEKMDLFQKNFTARISPIGEMQRQLLIF